MFLKTLLNCNTAVLHLLLEHRRQLAGYLCEFFFFVYHCNHIKVTKHMLEVIMRSETSQPVLKISQNITHVQTLSHIILTPCGHYMKLHDL